MKNRVTRVVALISTVLLVSVFAATSVQAAVDENGDLIISQQSYGVQVSLGGTTICGLNVVKVVTDPSGPGRKLRVAGTATCSSSIVGIATTASIAKLNGTVTASDHAECVFCKNKFVAAAESGIPWNNQRHIHVTAGFTLDDEIDEVGPGCWLASSHTAICFIDAIVTV